VYALVELATDVVEIVVEGELLAGGVEQAHGEIDGGAETLTADFEEEGLAGLGSEAVEIGLAIFGDAGDGDGGRDAVAAGVAGCGIDEQFDGVGAAARGEERELDRAVGGGGGDAEAGAGRGAVHREDGTRGPFEAGFAVEAFAEERNLLLGAGRDGERGDGVEVRSLADIGFVGEGGVEADVRRLHDDEVFAGFGELVREEGIPDEPFFVVVDLGAVGVEQKEGGVEAIAIAGRAEIEDPAGAFCDADFVEVEVTVKVQAAHHRGGEGDRLGLGGSGVGFVFEDAGLVADAE